MSALTFECKKTLAQRVDLSPLSCHRIRGLATEEINAIELISGKNRLRVDELFNVSGNNTENVIIRNSTDKFDHVGRDMESGTVSIEGNAGAYLGFGLKSGSITVQGNAGMFAACEMQDGFIEINGNAGDFVGAALPGNKRGMQGGTVLVKGHAGERVGDQMRRGMILIEGNVGDYCGSRMIAGTIAVIGASGNYLGYGMNRGTLLLWQPPKLSATFMDCGLHTSAFLPILFKSWQKFDGKFADPDMEFHRIQRFGGDMAGLGMGEVLVKIQ